MVGLRFSVLQQQSDSGVWYSAYGRRRCCAAAPMNLTMALEPAGMSSYVRPDGQVSRANMRVSPPVLASSQNMLPRSPWTLIHRRQHSSPADRRETEVIRSSNDDWGVMTVCLGVIGSPTNGCRWLADKVIFRNGRKPLNSPQRPSRIQISCRDRACSVLPSPGPRAWWPTQNWLRKGYNSEGLGHRAFNEPNAYVGEGTAVERRALMAGTREGEGDEVEVRGGNARPAGAAIGWGSQGRGRGCRLGVEG
ncbi:hypothetical protein HGRIS_011955 [Hohenbuehelia grisea]|uniref:Uncharacterized protein n=1 Tax=Hohenbuehelia grisea TaxID=104357 RepID=A0ABR3JWU7_9AGAR